MVTLTAGLATAAPARRLTTWVMPSMTVAISCAAAAAAAAGSQLQFSETERLYLAFALPDDRWRWLALLYPATVVALASMIPPRRRLVRAAAASLVTPILAATVTAVLFF